MSEKSLLSCGSRLPDSFESWPLAQKDCRAWEPVASPTASNLTAVCYGNGVWLALSANPGIVLLSPDGITWQKVAVPGGSPLGVTALRFINGRFIAKGYTWKQSLDGIHWTNFPLPPDSKVADVIYANGRWVCVGSSGLFASAQEPGNWSVNKSAITSRPVAHLVHMGGRFHAFSYWTTGMQPFSSADGITWTIHPQTKGIWFDHLEAGQIARPDGTVENVVAGTLNGEHYHIGRVEGDCFKWETGKRDGCFGRLIYRRSAGAARSGSTRRDWISLERDNSSPKRLRVYSLRAPGEVPSIENPGTLNDILAIAAGPDAMIATGTGGLIRRYPTGLPEPEPVADLTICPVMELKWKSAAGRDYQIEESTDLAHWRVATPAPLIGTGARMSWTAPETAEKRFYRLRMH